MTDAQTTLHLTPIAHWEAQMKNDLYVAESFEREGFIHCTDGEERLIDVGNRYYVSDPRPYCAITLDVSCLTSEVIYEDLERVYPHVYGPINLDAVRLVRRVTRDKDGRFVSVGAEHSLK